MARVLLIDDRPLDRRICVDALTGAGLDVDEAGDGTAGLRMLYERRPDVVLLDVVMPAMDGWVVCQRIREVSDVPIIMLTALNQESEMVRGLELGADDFVSKPVSPRHLVARVNAVLRRYGAPAPAAPELLYDDGVLAINAATHDVMRSGRPVALTPTEFRLLVALAKAPGRVHTYAELLGSVWGPEYIGDLDFLRVYVWRLRRKLETSGDGPNWIRNERGFGYRFVTAGNASEPQPGGSEPRQPSDEPHKLILLVEDDALSLKLMRDVLEANGYQTDEVRNGVAALEIVPRLCPDLVVMDIGLPGMDGVAVTRRLKREPATRDIPVVAVTAYAMPADEARMREAGCDAFLTKPLRLAELVSVVESFAGPARQTG